VRTGFRTSHADALHQAGRRADAETRFREAEQMQAERQPVYPIFPSPANFNHCEFLLAGVERDAWNQTLGLDCKLPATEIAKSCQDAKQRAQKTLSWDGIAFQSTILSPSLDHLTLGRSALYAAIPKRSAAFTPFQRPNESAPPNDDELRRDLKAALQTARHELDAAVDGLRRAGHQDSLPLGLLTRAWLRFLTGACIGPDSAQEDLDEAWEIAERGPMKLHMADIHLYRARLFGKQRAEGSNQKSEVSAEKYPWESPAADLAAAEKLINECGYHRRDEELADAKRAILGSP